MVLGPHQIIACPQCRSLVKHISVLAGYPWNICCWTDGRFTSTPEMPPAVVKCGQCNICYWLSKAEVIGQASWWNETAPPEWQSARNAEQPAESDYYAALKNGLATNLEEEKQLRILAWQRRNDIYRNGTETSISVDTWLEIDFQENLEVLLNLLPETDDENRLIKAEVLRTMGDMKSAKQVLYRITSPESLEVATQLRSLCDSGDTIVRPLRHE